jgi:hypothetical protein
VRRSVRLVAAAAAVGLLSTGCQLGRSLSQEEVVVYFGQNATAAEHVAAERHCAHFPDIRPEPIPTHAVASARLYDVRYQVDGASNYTLNRLYNCLVGQPGVVGVDIPDTGGF